MNKALMKNIYVDGKEVKGYYAVVDANTDSIYNVVSSRYSIVQHDEAINIIESAISNFPEFGKPVKNYNLYNNNARLKATYSFPNINYKVNIDDLVPCICMYNSYDGSYSFEVYVGLLRLICSNGLFIGEYEYKFAHKHTLSLNNEISLISDFIMSRFEKYSEKLDLFNRWTNYNVSDDEKESIIDSLELSNKQKERLLSEQEVSTKLSIVQINNLWLMYNLIVQFVNSLPESMQYRINKKVNKLFLYYK